MIYIFLSHLHYSEDSFISAFDVMEQWSVIANAGLLTRPLTSYYKLGNVCVSVCLCVCLSVRLYVSTVLNGSSPNLEGTFYGHDTFRGLYMFMCTQRARVRVRAKRAHVCVSQHLLGTYYYSPYVSRTMYFLFSRARVRARVCEGVRD
jgi:hypothetical protein